jgi:hypothetical protein
MRAHPWWKRSHFYFGGDGPNFKPSNQSDILLSTLGVGLVVACLYAAVGQFGAQNTFLFYGAPWLWTNHWIRKSMILQTFSSHNYTNMPCNSNYNVPPTHGFQATVLSKCNLVLPARLRLNHGPRFRFHRTKYIPRHGRFARLASPCVENSLLPRERGFECHQKGYGCALSK